MLDIARRDADLGRVSGQVGTVDVGVRVSEACELLERMLGSGYHIHREISLDLPTRWKLAGPSSKQSSSTW